MTQFRKILIAIDDGDTAEKVVLESLQLGQVLHTEFGLLSVVDNTSLMSEGAVTPGELADIIEKDLRANQQQFIVKHFNDAKVTAFIERGKPSEVILRVANDWNANLIVLGTHGRTGLAHLLMGSIAENVIRHSHKPVVVIPTKK